MKVTKISVDQLLSDSTRWVSSDTVIYNSDGRLEKIDFIHFSYTDSSVVAQCDSTPPNVRGIRRCELVSKPGYPVTILQSYYHTGRRNREYSHGVVISTDSLVTFEFKHYMTGYDQPVVEHIAWRMNKEGLLASNTDLYNIPGEAPVYSECVYTYDPASKMRNQDLTALTFYMSPTFVEDLVIMIGGYLPAMLKDIPVDIKINQTAGESSRSTFIPSFDEKGRCVGAKMDLNGKLHSTVTVEY